MKLITVLSSGKNSRVTFSIPTNEIRFKKGTKFYEEHNETIEPFLKSVEVFLKDVVEYSGALRGTFVFAHKKIIVSLKCNKKDIKYSCALLDHTIGMIREKGELIYDFKILESKQIDKGEENIEDTQ